MWRGVTAFKKCDIPQGVTRSFRKMCQLMERCDGHVRGYGEVYQL